MGRGAGDQSHYSQRDWPTEENHRKKLHAIAHTTHGHCDFETELALLANSVKIHFSYSSLAQFYGVLFFLN